MASLVFMLQAAAVMILSIFLSWTSLSSFWSGDIELAQDQLCIALPLLFVALFSAQYALKHEHQWPICVIYPIGVLAAVVTANYYLGEPFELFGISEFIHD